MVFFHSYVCLPEGNFQNGGDLGTLGRHLIRYMGMSKNMLKPMVGYELGDE